MADETKTSLMMKFEDGGGPIEAECPLFINSLDTLATQGFPIPVKNSATVMAPAFKLVREGNITRYFLLKSFGFAVSLASGEMRKAGASGQKQGAPTGAAAGGKPPAASTGHRHAAGGLGLGHTSDSANASGKASAGDEFALWRSATDNSWNKDGNFVSHIDDFHFTRFVDCATNQLFNACCKGTTFKTASLIKRKALRSEKGSTIDLSYLRIDFAGVKITSLDWSDGDILEETCKFTCDGMQIRYAQQDNSGNLSPALIPVGWSNPMTQTTGRGTGSS